MQNTLPNPFANGDISQYNSQNPKTNVPKTWNFAQFPHWKFVPYWKTLGIIVIIYGTFIYNTRLLRLTHLNLIHFSMRISSFWSVVARIIWTVRRRITSTQACWHRACSWRWQSRSAMTVNNYILTWRMGRFNCTGAMTAHAPKKIGVSAQNEGKGARKLKKKKKWKTCANRIPIFFQQEQLMI